MKKWHIKITIECIETKDNVVFELNGNDRKVDVNLDNFNAEWSELFKQAIEQNIEWFNLTDKLLKAIEEYKD